MRATGLGPAMHEGKLELLDLVLQGLVVEVVDIDVQRTPPALVVGVDRDSTHTKAATQVRLDLSYGQRLPYNTAVRLCLPCAPGPSDFRRAVGNLRTLEGSQHSCCV